jgi:hypothetical protein
VEDCLGDCGGSAVEDECGICDGDGSSCGDDGGSDGGGIGSGCDLPSNNLYLLGGDVLYNSEFEIGGFQFDVDGATVSSAAGGDAADAGFTVQAGGSTVLGFSFTGGTIPPGCGLLTSLSINGNADGLNNIVMADGSGEGLDFSYYNDSSSDDGGDDGGDDGECDDADEDGLCDDIDDCVGEYDECGTCNGDGIADGACDCDGNVDDECGICGGDGSSCGDDGGLNGCTISVDGTTLQGGSQGSVFVSLSNDQEIGIHQFLDH